jgi:hypothetical protein
MRDRPNLDEHSDLVTAGLLAEDVVFAASALKRGRRASKDDRRALESARTLLAFIESPAVRHVGHEEIGNLSGSTGALEVLRVVESQAPPSDVRKFLEELIHLLDRGLAGENVSAEQAALDSLQRLFAALGDVALARANSLAVATEDRLLWRHVTTTSAS